MLPCQWPRLGAIGACSNEPLPGTAPSRVNSSFPDSPYARVIRPAQDLELADAGLWSRYVPPVESCIAGFATEPAGPSWCAAVDRVCRAWIDAGQLDGPNVP